MEEFQQSSRELEQEMEAQLDQQERRLNEFAASSQRQQAEIETWKDKYNALQKESRDQIQRLDNELVRTRSERDHHRDMIRELEQANDDLDRAQRHAFKSVRPIRGCDFRLRVISGLSLCRLKISKSE